MKASTSARAASRCSATLGTCRSARRAPGRTGRAPSWRRAGRRPSAAAPAATARTPSGSRHQVRRLSRTLTKKLRTGRPPRKHRRSPMACTPRFIAPGRLIHSRPAVVEHRTRIGDWEGDLIVGRASRSAIGTLVDRRTGYLRLVHLPDGHSAERLRPAMLPVLTGLPVLARQTLTWDQGSEMACHHLLEEYFADGIFFAPPASPWLRGTNENTNGLLRQYFPKGSHLRSYTLDDLRPSRTASTADRASGSAGAAPPMRSRPNWQPEPVSVATTTRIRRRTHPSRGGQFSGVVDIPSRDRLRFLSSRYPVVLRDAVPKETFAAHAFEARSPVGRRQAGDSCSPRYWRTGGPLLSWVPPVVLQSAGEGREHRGASAHMVPVDNRSSSTTFGRTSSGGRWPGHARLMALDTAP